jgi:hypothetical protein
MNPRTITNGFESIHNCNASIIGWLVFTTLSLEAIKMLWRSAKRARANNMRMLSSGVALEQVMEHGPLS